MINFVVDRNNSQHLKQWIR